MADGPRSIELTTLLRIAAAVVVLVGAGWFAWDWYSGKQAADRTAEISSQVKDSLQQYVKNDPDIKPYNVRVLSVDLIQVGAVKYEGMAKVRAASSTVEHDVSIEVTADGERMMWESPPGEFLFLENESDIALTPAFPAPGWGMP